MDRARTMTLTSRSHLFRILIVCITLTLTYGQYGGDKVLPVYGILQDNLQASSDFITQDLFEKYSDIDPNEFWHPHSLTSTSSSREIIRVDKVEKQWIPGKYLQWKYARVGFHHYVIGITSYSIDVLGSDFKKISSIDSSQQLISLTVFSRWNFEGQCPEVVIPVATRKGIEIYKLENDIITKVSDGWPLHYEIKALEYCHVGAHTKLVVVPSETKYPVNIYNVAINSTNQVWYHQRLPVTAKSYVTVYELASESYIAISSGLSINIYSYDYDKGRYASHQNISIAYPSQQLVSFSVAYKHYLASVPSVPSAKVEFFGFSGHQYSKEDGIADVQAHELHALTVEDYRDEHFVLSKERSGGIDILAYDGHSFSSDGYQCPKDICTSKASLEKGVGYTINDLSYYVLPAAESSSQSEVLVISKYTEDTISPLYKQSVDVISELKALFQRYKRWEGIVTSAKETLSDALSLTDSNVVTGNWELGSLYVKSIYMSTNKLHEGNPFNKFLFLGISWIDFDFAIKLADLDDIIFQIRDLTDEAKRILSDSIPINSDQVEVVSGAQWVTGSFSATSLSVNSMDATIINYQQNLDDFLASFLLYQRSLYLQSSAVRFRGKLNIEYLFTTKLNGILVKDIAHLGKLNHFQCDLEFKQVKVQGDVKPNTVNGIRFADYILRAVDISGVRFVDGLVSVKGASILGPIESVQINKETFQKLLLRSTVQKTQVPYSFTEIVAEGSLKVTTINGIDFATFLRSIVTADFNGLIRGQKTLKGSLSAESLYIESTLNYFKFPQDLVTTAQKRFQISGVKNFDHLSATKVTVDGLIDGISTGDILSRLDYDTIKGKWTLAEGTIFLDDLTVKGYVDGVKMEALKHTQTLDEYRSSYYPDADIVFLQPVSFRNLKVRDNINYKKYEEIFGGLLSFDAREVKVNGTATFEKSISGIDLQVMDESINGIPLDDFFSLTLPQIISGEKTFEGDIRFASLFALDTFDTVNLKQLLEDSFRLSKARTISSKLSFDEIHCSKLKVEGPVNGMQNFGESVAVIKGRREQIFLAPMEIHDFTAASLQILDNLDVKRGKTIDDLDFNSWNTRRISLSKDFRTSKPVEIHGNVLTRSTCEIRTLNDVLLSYLDSNVLRTDRVEQTFTNKFTTSGPIRVENGNVLFEQQVSGYDLNRIFDEGIPLRSKNEVTVTGNWDFQSLHITSELTVEVDTCGVDLVKLDVDSLRSGESDVYISGENTFMSKIEVKEDLVVGKVNSDDLFSYVFTTNTAQEIKGRFTFEGDVYLDGELISYGSINSVSLPWLASVYACENGTTHVLKYDVNGDAYLESNSLHVRNLVQGMDIKKFFLSIINVNDKSLRITGEKTFTNSIKVEGNMNLETVNGVPAELLKGILLKTQNTQFQNPVVFTKGVEAPYLRIASGDIYSKGLVGDFNLTELIAEAAYLNARESLGTLSIDSALIQGNIDGVKILNGVLLEDVIRLDKPQRLRKLNVDKAVIQDRNIEVGGLVCGYQILEEYGRSLFSNSNRHQIVKGSLVFGGNVIINGNLECLNEVRDDIVLLDEGRRIESPLTFSRTITVEDSLKVSGTINGQTLEDLETNYLTNGREETISGYWNFAGGVTFKGQVTGNDQLDGFNIGELVDQKKAEAITAEENFTAERNSFVERCALLDLLYKRIAQSPVKLEFFETHQPSIQLKQTIQNLAFIQAGNVSRILTASKTCELATLEFDTTTELFKSAYTITKLGDVRQMESVTIGDTGILVIRSGSSCSGAESVSFLTMDSSGVYSAKQSLISGSCSQISFTEIRHGEAAALFILRNDHKTVQLYLGDISQAQFILIQEITLEVAVIRMKATPFRGTVGLFYQSEVSVHFHLFELHGKSSEIGSLPFVGRSTSQSATDLIQIVKSGRKTFGFLEGPDSFIPSECTLQVFEINLKGIRLFQRLHTPAVLSMQGISFGNQDFVALLTKDAGLQIYRFKGLSGFQPIDASPLRIPGAIKMQTLNLRLWKHRLSQPFIAISTATSLHFVHSILNGDAVYYDHKITDALCRIDSAK